MKTNTISILIVLCFIILTCFIGYDLYRLNQDAIELEVMYEEPFYAKTEYSYDNYLLLKENLAECATTTFKSKEVLLLEHIYSELVNLELIEEL